MGLRFAVVGDVHGHLALTYAVLGRWQRESGERLDLILQVGDLGAFPEAGRADGPTRRRAERDLEELGFATFAGASAPLTLLDPRPPLVFIPGNHEDFDYLESCDLAAPASDAVYPVSADAAILGLRSGRVFRFEYGGLVLRVAGVSGVDNRRHKRSRHPRYHLDEAGALALAALGHAGFDVFLSHDCPEGAFDSYRGTPASSPSLRLVIDEVRPPLAFFGHYGKTGEWTLGATRVLALAGSKYTWAGGLERGGIALVRWDGTSFEVERLDAEWLVTATRTSWRHWR